MESLAKLAGRRAAEDFSTHPVRTLKLACQMLPMQIQIFFAIALQHIFLSDFIIYHGGSLAHLRKKWSDYQFKLFMIHFLKEGEKNGQLNDNNYPSSRYKLLLRNFTIDYKLHLENTWKIEFDKHTEDMNIKTDWAILSLGLEKRLFPLKDFIISIEKKIFEARFQTYISVGDLPLPSFYKFFTSNANDSYFAEPDVVPKEPRRRQHQLPLPSLNYNYRENFLLRLLALFHKVNIFSFQEALVYAVDLLENPNYKTTFYFRKFFIHIWGNLALIFAGLNLHPNLIDYCFDQMSLCEDCEYLDLLLYKQKTYFLLNDFRQEKKMFFLMQDIVPKISDFYSQSIIIHLGSFLKKIENTLVTILCFKKCIKMGTYKVAEIEDLIEEKFELGSKQILQAKMQLHRVLAFPEIYKDKISFRKCEVFFELLQLCKLMLFYVSQNSECSPTLAEYDDNLKAIALKLEEDKLHINLFLSMFKDSDYYTFSLYKENVSMHRLKIQRIFSHNQFNRYWSDLCFVNYLLMEIFLPQMEESEYFHIEACKFYMLIHVDDDVDDVKNDKVVSNV